MEGREGIPAGAMEWKAEKRITLQDALKESRGLGLVYKVDQRNVGEAVDRMLKVDPETKQKLEKFEGSGRLLGHLFRLLSEGRSDAERNLAHLFLDQYNGAIDRVESALEDEDRARAAFEAQKQIKDFDEYVMALSSIRKVAGGDCADTAMWWTYAPYLSESMKEEGVGDAEAMDRLVRWSVPAAEFEGREHNRVHLPGLEFLNRDDGRAEAYILSPDPKGASHAFTAREAEQLVEKKIV